MEQECKLCFSKDDPEDYVKSPIRKLMEGRHICFRCAYWLNRKNQDEETSDYIPVIVDGSHYSLPKDYPYVTDKGWPKPVGDHYILFIETGRVIHTNNLWHQGTIPEMFVNNGMFKDNAIFITHDQYMNIMMLSENSNTAPYEAVCPQWLIKKFIKNLNK